MHAFTRWPLAAWRSGTVRFQARTALHARRSPPARSARTSTACLVAAGRSTGPGPPANARRTLHGHQLRREQISSPVAPPLLFFGIDDGGRDRVRPAGMVASQRPPLPAGGRKRAWRPPVAHVRARTETCGARGEKVRCGAETLSRHHDRPGLHSNR